MKCTLLWLLLVLGCDEAPLPVAVVAAPRSLDAGAPMASTLDLCESICAAREQVKELSAKRDALKVEVEELKRQAAVRGLVVPP